MIEDNKPIIIDGVDVSNCKDLHYGCECFSMIEPVIECKNCSDCYFKQLARKTQECEELKNKLKYIRDENTYLKESATDKQIDFLALNNYIKTLKFQIDQLNVEKEQAKQKLERIKIGLREIFRCLIKENRKETIKDTIWVNNITTLWDYMANLLELQGDQNEIEEQIIDEVE